MLYFKIKIPHVWCSWGKMKGVFIMIDKLNTLLSDKKFQVLVITIYTQNIWFMPELVKAILPSLV